jgi:hypothetical protein
MFIAENLIVAGLSKYYDDETNSYLGMLIVCHADEENYV